MDRTIVTPPALAAPKGHYSHGVVVSSARTLYVAGQVPLDSDGTWSVAETPPLRRRRCSRTCAMSWRLPEGRVEDIAKTSVFLVDLGHRPAVGEVRRRFFSDMPPANTLLIVESLASPDFLVEIEAIVPLPD